jgi:hypothetical protein
MILRIYYRRLGGHVHCRVFTTGLVGELVFGQDEWPDIVEKLACVATFINDEATE